MLVTSGGEGIGLGQASRRAENGNAAQYQHRVPAGPGLRFTDGIER
jgi:hypothetical protein